MLHATAIGQGDSSRAEASVADLALVVGGHSIEADFLQARARAQCQGPNASAAGDSEIVGLTIDGQRISVGSEPNQSVSLPNGRVTINEQTSAGSGDITVNALHVVIDGVADVVVSSAHADIVCAQPSCVGDFMTGGGWITGTPSSAKGNFGVAGGTKNGALWGHLLYIDHGTGMKVKGTGVTAYTVTGPNKRHIEGTAEVNGQAGFSYQVDVADKGEPGRDDTFALLLSNGYSASGSLVGGNIQLHLCNK